MIPLLRVAAAAAAGTALDGEQRRPCLQGETPNLHTHTHTGDATPHHWALPSEAPFPPRATILSNAVDLSSYYCHTSQSMGAGVHARGGRSHAGTAHTNGGRPAPCRAK